MMHSLDEATRQDVQMAIHQVTTESFHRQQSDTSLVTSGGGLSHNVIKNRVFLHGLFRRLEHWAYANSCLGHGVRCPRFYALRRRLLTPERMHMRRRIIWDDCLDRGLVLDQILSDLGLPKPRTTRDLEAY